jgi:hypothetical protein
MYCENCGAKIEEGRDYCNQCGTNIVPERANDPVKVFQPISTPVQARESMAKADLIVGGIIIVSLILQARIFAKANQNIAILATLAFPIVYGVIAARIYKINNTYKLKKIIARTLLSFLISSCLVFPYIVTSYTPTWSLWEVLFMGIYGLFIAAVIVSVNMFLFYSVILVVCWVYRKKEERVN